MRPELVLLLCILAAGLLHPGYCRNEIGPDDCCFSFYSKRLRKTLVRSYYTTDQRCPKAGIILVSQKGRHVCVDPSLSWVEAMVKRLDEASF